MAGYLGYRQVSAVITSNGQNPYGDGNWVATFDPKVFAASTNDFEIYHMALTGPAGSSIQVWIDRTFYDTTPHGDLNSWDPNEPLHLSGGNTLYLYWDSSNTPVTGLTPLVTVWLRQTSVL